MASFGRICVRSASNIRNKALGNAFKGQHTRSSSSASCIDRKFYTCICFIIQLTVNEAEHNKLRRNRGHGLDSSEQRFELQSHVMWRASLVVFSLTLRLILQSQQELNAHARVYVKSNRVHLFGGIMQIQG